MAFFLKPGNLGVKVFATVAAEGRSLGRHGAEAAEDRLRNQSAE